jgi:hypothetical protein
LSLTKGKTLADKNEKAEGNEQKSFAKRRGAKKMSMPGSWGM